MIQQDEGLKKFQKHLYKLGIKSGRTLALFSQIKIKNDDEDKLFLSIDLSVLITHNFYQRNSSTNIDILIKNSKWIEELYNHFCVSNDQYLFIYYIYDSAYPYSLNNYVGRFIPDIYHKTFYGKKKSDDILYLKELDQDI